MIKIREAIVVEGKYDKNALSQVVDAMIVETSGFGVFHDKEKQQMIRTLADKNGIIILTDSDGAGLVIRNFLKGIIPRDQIKNAYIPEIIGKEKRKRTPSREGMLGVEGMNKEVLESCLRKCDATFLDDHDAMNTYHLNKSDLYRIGLSGKPDSAKKRETLLKKLGLPSNLSTNDLLDYINRTMSKMEIEKLVDELV